MITHKLHRSHPAIGELLSVGQSAPDQQIEERAAQEGEPANCTVSDVRNITIAIAPVAAVTSHVTFQTAKVTDLLFDKPHPDGLSYLYRGKR